MQQGLSRIHLECRVRQWCPVGYLYPFRPVGLLRPSNLPNLALLHKYEHGEVLESVTSKPRKVSSQQQLQLAWFSPHEYSY